MNPFPSRTPYASVRKRNGQVVPFDADKISRALFAAGESLGRPDSFLARELSDSILHFLAEESLGPTPSTSQIEEVVIKVVRELGQPEIARHFADRAARNEASKQPASAEFAACAAGSESRAAPGLSSESAQGRFGPTPEEIACWLEDASSAKELQLRAGAVALEQFALREMYSRDLVAAYRDGLIELTGLETPLALAGYVVPMSPADEIGAHSGAIFRLLDSAAKLTSGFLILDGPEYALAARRFDETLAKEFGRTLAIFARGSGIQMTINLNCRTPPSWAGELAKGPLFRGSSATSDSIGAITRGLLAGFASDRDWPHQTRIFYHLSAADVSQESDANLSQSISLLTSGVPITFVFDRPRRAIQLCEGIDRGCPASLIAIGLGLSRLVHQLGSRAEPERFIDKLGTLARLALNAAAQKRDFVKKQSNQPELHRGFLIDRARSVIVPLGLDKVTRVLIGEELAKSTAALEFGKAVLARLQQALQQDAPSYVLNACLDDWPIVRGETSSGISVLESKAANSENDKPSGHGPFRPSSVSLNSTEFLKLSGALQDAAGRGTAILHLSKEQVSNPQEILELLVYSGQETHLGRLHFQS